jgi:hypothetical protein
MILIGADAHKSTHTLAVIDAVTGQLLATRTVRADADGVAGGLALGAWAWR